LNKILLDTTYSINLGTNYFIDDPIISEDWLLILLYFDEVYSLIGQKRIKLFDGIITISEYPIEAIKNDYKITNSPLSDPLERTLRLISFCIDNDIHYMPNPHDTDRDSFISQIGVGLPTCINKLKFNFLNFDILTRVIKPYLPNISGKTSIELCDAIKKYKESTFYDHFITGIDLLCKTYKGNYFMSEEMDNEIQNYIIKNQRAFLKLIDFDKIKSFNFKSILEDGVGEIGELLTPFLPLGAIIELYNFIRNTTTLEQNKDMLFVFSLMYLQKVLTPFFKKDISPSKQCEICKITSAEVEIFTEEESDNFLLERELFLCRKHLEDHLYIRKFYGFTGKNLLRALKTI